MSSLHNNVRLVGHLMTNPKPPTVAGDPPRLVTSFLLNVPRAPDPETATGILFDVIPVRVEGEAMVRKARDLRDGVMVAIEGHMVYNPQKREALAVVVDEFEYMGAVLYIQTKKELLGVMAGEQSILSGAYKKGFLAKNVEILRVKG